MPVPAVKGAGAGRSPLMSAPELKDGQLRVLTINTCLMLPGMCNVTVAGEMGLAQVTGILGVIVFMLWLTMGCLTLWWNILLRVLLLPLCGFVGIAVGAHGWILIVGSLKYALMMGRNCMCGGQLSSVLRCDDHRGERVQQLAEQLANGFDVVVCQEVFTSWWSDRYRRQLIEAADKAGLSYYAHTPGRGPRFPQTLVGDGLLILSRFPIEHTEVEFYRGSKNLPIFDMFHTTRGCLYARIRPIGAPPVHVFTTHLSPDEQEIADRAPVLNMCICQTEDSQNNQCTIAADFIEKCIRAKKDENASEPTLRRSDSLISPSDDIPPLEDESLLDGVTIVAGDFNFGLPAAGGTADHKTYTRNYSNLSGRLAKLGITDCCKLEEGWLPSFGHLNEDGSQAEKLLTHSQLWGSHITEDLIFTSVPGCTAEIKPLKISDPELQKKGIKYVSDHFGIACNVPISGVCKYDLMTPPVQDRAGSISDLPTSVCTPN